MAALKSDKSIPEEPSSDKESGEDDSEPENDTEWTDTLRIVHVEQLQPRDWALVSCRF